jgi:hypothetical protein
MPCYFSCHSGRSDRPEMTTLRYRNDDPKAGQGPYCPVDAGDCVTVCDLGV